jgi:hypothetical protein
MSESGYIANGIGDIWPGAKSKEGSTTKERFVRERRCGGISRIMIHMK